MCAVQEFRQILEAHRIQDQQRNCPFETSDDELIDRMFDFVHAIQSMLALQLTVRHDQQAVILLPLSEIPS